MSESNADAYWLGRDLEDAQSEINRHHTLIAEMREALEWALAMIENLTERFTEDGLVGDDQDKFDKYQRLLNRQVG